MSETKHPLKVFLCHASADKPKVRELYRYLRRRGIKPWFDEMDLVGGQDWQVEIPKAISTSDAIIICLTENSVDREGYIQKEIKFALDKALEMPEGRIFLIPVRFEECEVPYSLSRYQWVDLFDKAGFARMMRSLKFRAAQLQRSTVELPPRDIEEENLEFEKAAREKPEREATEKTERERAEKDAPKESQVQSLAYEAPKLARLATASDNLILSNGMELMRVPAGMFLMGSTKENKLTHEDEQPQHTVDIRYDYWMARFPVTNELYNAYVQANEVRHPVDGWMEKKDHPVVYVKWTDAMTYCQWLNNLLESELPSGLVLRLPTEAEWEKAARGSPLREGERRGGEVNEWPWGNQFDKNKCNSIEGGKGGTTPVGLYSPQGDSPYGCADMAGNIWEWTHTLKKKYPYNASDGRENEKSSGNHVLRGGSFMSMDRLARCASRIGLIIDSTFFVKDFGFRVVASPA